MIVYLVPEWAQIRHSDKWQLKVLPLLNSTGISYMAVSCMGGVTHWNVCTSRVFPIDHNTFEVPAAPLAMIRGIILKLLHMHVKSQLMLLHSQVPRRLAATKIG